LGADEILSSINAREELKGTTLEVYRFLLKSSKPVGAREIQRALNFSSPSLAAYHLSKLEEIGLVRKENGEFIIAKNLLEDCIRVNRFLIPRYLFYSIFAALALVVELTFFRPAIITREYFFFTGVTFLCMLAFCFETAKTWSKRGI
jgi:DNA-binding transcriptional ArsR family regulator